MPSKPIYTAQATICDHGQHFVVSTGGPHKLARTVSGDLMLMQPIQWHCSCGQNGGGGYQPSSILYVTDDGKEISKEEWQAIRKKAADELAEKVMTNVLRIGFLVMTLGLIGWSLWERFGK